MVANKKRINSNKLVLPKLSYKLMGLLFNVHNELGSSLLEKYYQRAIEKELNKHSLSFKKELKVDLIYDNEPIGKYFLDFIIEDLLILETKTQEHYSPKFFKQALAYLRQTNKPLAIIANFKGSKLRYKRIVNPDYNQSINLEEADAKFE